VWQEINSAVEGNYMERFWRGAFRDTIKQSRKGMRVLFNHERDLIGLKLLGVIEELEEDRRWAVCRPAAEHELYEGSGARPTRRSLRRVLPLSGHS
jgi:phage head maturation protease